MDQANEDTMFRDLSELRKERAVRSHWGVTSCGHLLSTEGTIGVMSSMVVNLGKSKTWNIDRLDNVVTNVYLCFEFI
jgi:hypothetical protein